MPRRDTRNIGTEMSHKSQFSLAEKYHMTPPNNAANRTLQSNSTQRRHGAYGLISPQKQMNRVVGQKAHV